MLIYLGKLRIFTLFRLALYPLIALFNNLLYRSVGPNFSHP